MAIIQKKWGNKKPPLGVRHNLAHPLSSGLVGHWLMNEGSGANLYDSSSQNNSGAITTPTWLPGPLGPELDLPSASYVDCGNKTAFSFGTGPFSVCVRVRVDANTGSGAFPAIVEKGQGDWSDGGVTHTGWWIGHVDSDKWTFRIGDGSVGLDVAELVVATYPTYYFFVGVVTTTQIIPYRNGIQQTAITRTKTNSTDTSQNLNIGRWRQFDRRLNGAISDVRIYNRALSAAEVAQLYAEPFADMVPMRIPIVRGVAVGARPRLIDGRLVNHGLLLGGLVA